ncbi:ABC transporter ATP-binding protein [Sinorhizobium meliloti]|uniref:MsbA-like saccharide exporting ABC transporter protein n=3 Tax=Rhizobium meliloti TaxID=382 RepID=F7XK40_SINMM|nr:ABC transporter ATP-binding protein [Sinorhizobium meliloti]AEH83368.1 msbA-like saccharide exporting ABC transporter protein [Sinorhizobium meliloti SM11]ATA97073.1 multidrug ABC transporter ATP-binding protein [Sinorhizobium meliloti]ATB02611.1 multidrug ABC transporter ATP-binding protein [Sinorhizobium meliloti]MBP2468062.1 ATP-binding cassette subfamily B protein [Sinorhizobium meliloti]MDE4561148.1 ABC transporter ATP-binding protein/permease [Sinorhizobium meliloti SM11]
MAFTRFTARNRAFRSVFRFSWDHWKKQPVRLAALLLTVLLSTLADVLTPLYSGRLVDAVISGAASDDVAWNAAMAAFMMLMALSFGAIILRHVTFMGIVSLTLKMMSDIAAAAFHHIQRFSSDWHANSFAGSTVRKVTRGMWALDLLNDTLLVALFPSIVMLVGSTALMAWYWPMMGVIIGLGSIAFIAVTVSLSLGYVAPMASLANSWDTRLGGALADAVSCNTVVKAFGAEGREDARLAKVLRKWENRTRRTWSRGTLNGTAQGAMLLVLRAAVIGFALLLWARGQATAGDITFVLTSFFILQGYLREVGMHIRNLQRSINDMEELVAIHAQPLGVEDRPGAKPIRITEGEIEFRDVTFHYGAHRAPLYEGFSVKIAAGERVGLVGHSGSGKTTFIKLIQRLHDLNAGEIRIDGQNIADFTQASLRQQIAIVQQEPILFHRSLAENIAYARPGATQRDIEEAARLASAHDFIAALPKGYGTLVGERGVKLSGGERQRVAIARAFLADAPILILDEATSSLDSESEVLIQQAMERLMTGRTTLVVAHRLSTVRALDRLLVFDRGRIAEEGDHGALIRVKGGIYRSLFERQALELTKGLILSEG